MRYAFLVALREFAENVKTKGFWIGIAIFPLLIFLSLQAEGWLEKAKPARNFVLVDQSGSFEEPIKVALERLHQRKVLGAFGSYVRANTRSEERAKVDLEKVGADATQALQDFASGNPSRATTRFRTAAELTDPPSKPQKPPGINSCLLGVSTAALDRTSDARVLLDQPCTNYLSRGLTDPLIAHWIATARRKVAPN